jgi:hypothetical protein
MRPDGRTVFSSGRKREGGVFVQFYVSLGGAATLQQSAYPSVWEKEQEDAKCSENLYFLIVD